MRNQQRSRTLQQVRTTLSPDDARLIVARDHGFALWSVVGGQCDPVFERAVDAVVLGRIDELDQLLANVPDLVRGRSARGVRVDA